MPAPFEPLDPRVEKMMPLGVDLTDLQKLASLPELLNVAFTGIKYEWQGRMQGEEMIGVLVFWVPLLPFIRFEIPFEYENLRAFHTTLDAAIEGLNEVRSSDT